MTSIRPVALVRYRPGVVGETARTVHLIPLPDDGRIGVGSALCGALLHPQQIEAVQPGQGMPCMACLFKQVLTADLSSPDAPEPPAAIGAG